MGSLKRILAVQLAYMSSPDLLLKVHFARMHTFLLVQNQFLNGLVRHTTDENYKIKQKIYGFMID